MDDALHSGLIKRVVLDRTHLHKCLLRSCVIVSDQLGTGNRQLARVVLQNVGERRNQPRQLDGFTNLILGHTEEIGNKFAGVVPLARIAKGLIVDHLPQLLAILAKSFFIDCRSQLLAILAKSC